MRMSQGVPSGRSVHIYHPELLNDHEEVIIYTREEFKRTYTLIQEQVDLINKLDFRRYNYQKEDHVDHWPMVMERVHILAGGMNSFFGDKPLQAYLDSYIYIASGEMDETHVKSLKSVNHTNEVFTESLGVGWL